MNGDDEAVGRILAQDPKWLESQDGTNALYYAVKNGHDTIVARLLAANPAITLKLNNAVDLSNRTVLHWAARGSTEGHNKVAAQLLAASPSLIDATDVHGWTALHYTCQGGSSSMAEMFLTIKPDLALATNSAGNTPLHFAAAWFRRGNAIKRLLELNPNALRAANKSCKTPFQIAVFNGNNEAIELMQSHLTFGEIIDCFLAEKKSPERYRSVVKSQCESLVVSLSQDVVGTVYEYVGIEQAVKKRPTKKQ